MKTKSQELERAEKLARVDIEQLIKRVSRMKDGIL